MPIKVAKKQKPKRKPGQRAHLTTDQVLNELAKLLEQAPDQVSIKTLAHRLGVFPTAIRSRFGSNIAEIIGHLVSDRIEKAVPELAHGEPAQHYLHRLLVDVAMVFEAQRELGRSVVFCLTGNGTPSPLLLDRVLGAVKALGADGLSSLAALQIILEALIGRAAIGPFSATEMLKMLNRADEQIAGAPYPKLNQAVLELGGGADGTSPSSLEDAAAWAHSVIARIEGLLGQ
jgi:hypothetical protein